MIHKAALSAAASLAALALAAGYNDISFAQAAPQAPAAQTPRQGRGGSAGDSAAPARKHGDGAGPFKKMVIRGVTLIDGTGGPPLSPMDIVDRRQHDHRRAQAGWPGLPQQANREPRDADLRDRRQGPVRDARLRRHARARRRQGQGARLSYSTSCGWRTASPRSRRVAVVGRAQQLGKDRSAKNEIAAPRIFNYQTLGSGWSAGTGRTPGEGARVGALGRPPTTSTASSSSTAATKRPEIDAAAIDEATRTRWGPSRTCRRTTSRCSTRAGRRRASRHRDALLRPLRVAAQGQDDPGVPVGYDYNNEQDRFGDIARIWNQTYEPGSPQWIEYLEHQKANHVTFDPTFNIYAASRDLMRARNADWHQTYTMPQLWNYFQSTRDNHGSYFYDWTTENEVAWKNFYQRYMRLINDYKNMGGRVTVGTDSGFIWKTYGFAYIEELELMREAGFLPLEIIRSATMWGARTLYEPRGRERADGRGAQRHAGRSGDRAENPLSNLKVLYGTGHMRLNPQTNRRRKWAASSTRSRTASSTTPRSCWRKWRRRLPPRNAR
jgi:hypothetical protein